MVEWREEHAWRCIPKNLSNEEYFPKKFVESLLYRALLLCESGVAYRDYYLKRKDNVIGENIYRLKISKPKSSEAKERYPKFISIKRDIVALDLAYKHPRSRPSKETKRNVRMESKWKSLDETNSHDSNSSDLGKDFQSQTPTSPSCLSNSSTQFSDDYTQMTDMSDNEFLTISSSNEDDCDSTFTASNASSSSALSSELERVTLDFSSNQTLSSECNKESEYPETADAVVDNNFHDVSLKNKDKETFKELLTNGLNQMLEKSQDDSAKSKIDSRSSSDFFEDREFDFLKSEPVKRSTSLKTYKTPPGTPGRKKAVRFADALGLDLEDVRHVLNLEDPPHIPASAMKDLQVGIQEAHRSEGTRYLSACFPQPGASVTFYCRVRDEKVVLENCIVNDSDLTVTGTVRVANIAYNKTVLVRHSINNWTTFTDVKASYVHNSCDGSTDRFSFTLNIPSNFTVGSKLQFAICYRANGQEFWDSNMGRNYVIECFARAVPISESDNTWLHFM